MGPDAPVAQRNILGVIHKVGLEIGGKVITMRKYGHHTVEIIGGRKVHPCTSIPGGLSKGITREQRDEIEPMGRWAVDFALFSLQLFKDLVLKNQGYVDLILGDIYTHKTYYMGMVDADNKVNFYDGKVRVVDPDGKEFVKYGPNEYREVIAEHVEPWTYLKFPYLKKVGWKGFVDGKESGVYMATPLSRLNAADGMATPRAQEAYEEFYKTLGGKPVHQRLATHWARLVELLYAAERWVELVTDPEITSDNYRTIPTETPTEGVGIVEAPRGTLTHHYATDERGRGHEGQPDRGHDEQLRAHHPVDQEGGRVADQGGHRAERAAAEHGRDGFPGLRPVLRLRHAQPARPDAAADHHPRRAGRGRGGGETKLLIRGDKPVRWARFSGIELDCVRPPDRFCVNRVASRTRPRNFWGRRLGVASGNRP